MTTSKATINSIYLYIDYVRILRRPRLYYILLHVGVGDYYFKIEQDCLFHDDEPYVNAIYHLSIAFPCQPPPFP